MKFFDKAFDRAVELARPVQSLSTAVKMCAEQMKNLVEAVALIAHNQAVHHHMIIQMYEAQQTIFSKINASGLDMKMPDAKKSKSDKPN